MNISATSGLIIMKHHWDGRKAAFGFGPDRIQTLVSMATDNSHMVIMEKKVLPLFLSYFFHPLLFKLAGNDGMNESSEEFEIQPDPTTNCGVSCP